MIASDEDAVVCDFAQYYHVLNWRSLPVRLSATLAAGLPPESRSQMLLHQEKTTPDNMLRAIIADTLNRLEWRIFGSNTSPPPSIVAALRGESLEEDSGKVRSFNTPEEFEAAMKNIEGGDSSHGD